MHVNHHVLCVCCRRCSVACVRRSTQYENVEGEKGNTHGYSVCGGLGGARRGPVWSTCAAPGRYFGPMLRFSHVVHLCDARELNENGIKLAVPGGLS